MDYMLRTFTVLQAHHVAAVPGQQVGLRIISKSKETRP